MITIYGKTQCQYCEMAKNLLESKGIGYTYKQLDRDFVREDLIAIAPRARSYPQIVVEGEVIGGFNELQRYLLENKAPTGPSFLSE